MVDKVGIIPNEYYTLKDMLAEKVTGDYQPDTIVGIARGGMSIARRIHEHYDPYNRKVNYVALGMRRYDAVETGNQISVYQEPDISYINGKCVLLVDDVADHGDSLVFAKKYLEGKGAKEVRIATIAYKPWSKLKPDYYIFETEKWIVFPGEYEKKYDYTIDRLKHEVTFIEA